MDIVISRATKQDADGILKLLSQVLEVHHNGRPDIFKTGATKYTKDELSLIICDDTKPILVAKSGIRMLGYAFCVIKSTKDDNILHDMKTLYIDDLCVDERYRGRHIGKALYESAVDLAREYGCYNLTLNVWSANLSALAFYEAQGLTPQKVGMELIL